jgi:hypothetical protein
MTLRAPFEGYTVTSVGLGCIVGECCYFRRFSQFCEKRLLSSSCLSVCLFAPVRPSVYPHGTTHLPLDGFSLNLIFEDFVDSLTRKFKLRLNFIFE